MPELSLPHSPMNGACYDQIRERAPLLWRALQERMIPLASGEDPVDERLRSLRALQEECWTSFLEQDEGMESVALGRSWPCAVGDVMAAVAATEVPAIAGSDQPVEDRRQQLEQLVQVLAEVAEDSMGTALVRADVQAAVLDLS